MKLTKMQKVYVYTYALALIVLALDLLFWRKG